MITTAFVYVIALAGIFAQGQRVTTPVKLGGIFEESDLFHRFVFAFAVDQINADNGREFYPVVNSIKQHDIMGSYRKACDLLMEKAVVVLSGADDAALAQTRSLCRAKRVPHLSFGASTASDAPLSVSLYPTTDAIACDLLMEKVVLSGADDAALARTRSLCRAKRVPHFSFGASTASDAPLSVSLYPTTDAMGRAVASVVNYYQWKSLVVLYEEDQGIIDLKAVLSLSSFGIGYPQHRKVIMRKVPIGGDYRPLLKEIKNRLQVFHLVVHARLHTIRVLMQQAASFDMTGDYYHYLFVNLDAYTLDMDTYKTTGCNITTFRLIDTESVMTTKLIAEMRESLLHQKDRDGGQIPMPAAGLYTSAALLYDSMLLISEAMKNVQGSFEPSSLICSSDDFWHDGQKFTEAIQQTEITGTTGDIKLDENGNRIQYQLDVIEIRKTGYVDIGVWNEDTGTFNVTSSPTEAFDEALETLENRTLKITVYLEEPFVMKKKSLEPLFGNDQYEGYCIDLLNRIAEYRNFNFTIQEVKDNAYGAKDASGQWNGMVGELVRNEADLALTSLTISYSRSEVIEFTVPFMHLGISILFKRPEEKDPGLFTFLSPLSLDVWIYLLASYIGVSMMLWILARFSPYEWYNPHPCDPDTDVVENQFNLLNSFWFTVGSLMQQGSDLTPRAASTRLVAGIWWFFTLVLISSYTANLAAFLTVERMVTPVENADDLAKQTRIKYGTLGRGSTMTFFKESKIQTYERMWAYMSNAQPSVFVNSSKGGIERVKAGDYAYLMESSMLEYAIERDCDLMQIGGLLDSKGYGIGLRKGSPFREAISTAILMLQEKTVLTELKEKWWKEMHGGGMCSSINLKQKSAGHNELGLKNVGGVFVILFGGLVLSINIAIVEFIYKCRKLAEVTQKSLCETMCRELRFAISCHQTTRPAPGGGGSKAAAISAAGTPSATDVGAAGGRTKRADLAIPTFHDASPKDGVYPLSSPAAEGGAITMCYENSQKSSLDYHLQHRPPKLRRDPTGQPLLAERYILTNNNQM